MYDYGACGMSALIAEQKERFGEYGFVHVAGVRDPEGVIDLAFA